MRSRPSFVFVYRSQIQVLFARVKRGEPRFRQQSSYVPRVVPAANDSFAVQQVLRKSHGRMDAFNDVLVQRPSASSQSFVARRTVDDEFRD